MQLKPDTGLSRINTAAIGNKIGQCYFLPDAMEIRRGDAEWTFTIWLEEAKKGATPAMSHAHTRREKMQNDALQNNGLQDPRPLTVLTISRAKLVVMAVTLSAISLSTASAHPSCGQPQVKVLASGLSGSKGSAVGPDGAVYVTENVVGRISRIDPRTGAITTFASGLPPAIVVQSNGTVVGGVMDVAFIGNTAYALVTMVGSDVGGNSTVGIYRIDGPRRFTVVADIGAYSSTHPPTSPFFLPTGVQYAIESYRGGFLVTDGHHNRVLHVTTKGEISPVIALGNVVPTGIANVGNLVFLALAGPIPHRPEDGKVLAFAPNFPRTLTIASGAPLLVDVEFGHRLSLYALSQGVWTGGEEGSPASPNTGSLVVVRLNGGFTTLVSGLDRPTSFELIGNTAYVVTLPGKVLKIEGLSCPPFGNDE